MREREMRQRVERFLQTRLRQMLMPATLGLGLALAGCTTSSDNSPQGSPDGSSAVGKQDSASTLADVSTAKQDTAGVSTDVANPAVDTQGTQVADGGGAIDTQGSLDTQGADSAKQDVGGAVMKYLAQFPDAGRDLPQAYPEYIAPQPDSGTFVRYMGPQPLYAAPMPLYMAQIPDAQS